MAKERIFDLPQTRGVFQIAGHVVGTEKDKFYEDKVTAKTQKPFRSVNFGVQTDKESTIYTYLNGMVQKSVFFNRSENKKKGIKKDTKEIPWKDRYQFKSDGYRMIGVKLGVKKVVDKNGKEVNDKKIMPPYDACQEIADNLKDGVSVFVKGTTEFSTYNGNHNVRFVPNQVSLCREIDFDNEEFTPNAEFTQLIVFTKIEKEGSRFVVSAKIVNYDSVEDAEFYIFDASLANVFRKNLKAYTAIKVWGNIVVEKDTEEVEEKDMWGTENKMDKVNSPTKRLLVITGADPSTIDRETYTEDLIDEALAKVAASKQAENDYGDHDSSEPGTWGSVSNTSIDDDDEEAPW